MPRPPQTATFNKAVYLEYLKDYKNAIAARNYELQGEIQNKIMSVRSPDNEDDVKEHAKLSKRLLLALKVSQGLKQNDMRAMPKEERDQYFANASDADRKSHDNFLIAYGDSSVEDATEMLLLVLEDI